MPGPEREGSSPASLHRAGVEHGAQASSLRDESETQSPGRQAVLAFAGAGLGQGVPLVNGSAEDAQAAPGFAGNGAAHAGFSPETVCPHKQVGIWGTQHPPPSRALACRKQGPALGKLRLRGLRPGSPRCPRFGRFLYTNLVPGGNVFPGRRWQPPASPVEVNPLFCTTPDW